MQTLTGSPPRASSPGRSEHAVPTFQEVLHRDSSRTPSHRVIGVGTPPPLPLRPLAIGILRSLEAKQAPERKANRDRGGGSSRFSAQAIGTGPESALTAWM